MKNLLACLAVLLAFSAGAQSMPYNPDANDDGYIGSPDLLSFLPLFGTQIGIDSNLTCDYDGTDFENFMAGVILGDIILDSVLVQYHVSDTDSIFIPGCPGLIADSVSLERVRLFDSFSSGSYPWNTQMQSVNGWENFGGLHFAWNANDNEFRLHFMDNELSSLSQDGFFGSSWNAMWTGTIPFPPEVSYDESGASLDWGGYFNWATYVNILPYYHYAE